MSMIGHNNPVVTVESLSEADRKRLRQAVQELNDSLTKVAAERDLQKEIINEINDKLGVDKKLIRRMAKVYYNASFGEEVEENNNFEDFYTKIIKEQAPQ
jgi:ABC-type microcin C transport system permease subunit YejB